MKRFWEFNLNWGDFFKPGPQNGLVDLEGLRVGNFTKVENDDIRTGITVIDPGVNDLFKQKLPAAVAVGNGFGKTVGLSQIQELGTLETPIALTNTLAVGPVMRGLVDLVLSQNPKMAAWETINAVVGETNDGFLNSVQADLLTKDDLKGAYQNLSDQVAVGCLGAGTGTRAFSWKGGLGTASRVVKVSGHDYLVAVLVQTNFGGSLQIQGVPIGQILNKSDFKAVSDGSCLIVMGTNAPLTARQLGRLATRSFLGLAQTGSVLAHGSGDYCLAFSQNRAGLPNVNQACLADKDLTVFFGAVVEVVRESVWDALFAAETTVGRAGNKLDALPRARVLDILADYRQLYEKIKN